MRKTFLASVAVLVSAIVSLLLANSVHAATFTVDSTADDPAVDPAVSCDTALDECTLRSAIEAANAQAGADSIEFDISGGGVHTFTPASPYDVISEQVTIDGSTQTGASCGTLVPSSLPSTSSAHTLLIEIDGTNGSPASWGILTLGAGADGSIVRGMALGRAVDFASGVYMTNLTSGTVECNYLGTNAAGTAAASNAAYGARVNDSTNIVIQNNLISGNTSSGVSSFLADDIDVNHNLVGTNAAGTSALPNSEGVNINNSGNPTLHQNVISGNTQLGAQVSGSNIVTVTANFAGLGVTGSPLGNGGDGLVIFGSNGLNLGGTSAGLGNVASANSGAGLHVYSNCDFGHSIGSVTYGNYLGTNTSGSVQSGYGNGGAGMEVNEYNGGCGSVYRHHIGGDEAGQANIMAGNNGQGLLIHQAGGQDVFSITAIVNSIYANGQFGIDLAYDSEDDGVADTDLGPNALNDFPIMYPTGGNANNYLNRPIINSTNYSGNQLTVNYSYQAPSITDNDPYLLSTDLVGYRLDFYINEGTQDGAYGSYSQGKTHLGSFIIDGSESGATHTFTSPVSLTNSQNITATATVLWENIPNPCPTPGRYGDGPPYQNTSCE